MTTTYYTNVIKVTGGLVELKNHYQTKRMKLLRFTKTPALFN